MDVVMGLYFLKNKMFEDCTDIYIYYSKIKTSMILKNKKILII